MPDNATEGVAEHSSRLQPSIRMPQLQHLFLADLVPMYYPRMDEDSGYPCTVDRASYRILAPKSYSILAPTRDLNLGPPGPQSRVVTTIGAMCIIIFIILFDSNSGDILSNRFLVC